LREYLFKRSSRVLTNRKLRWPRRQPLDSSIEVRQGSIIVVRLPENPTTGYRWVIEETDEEILEPESSDFALRPDAGIGGEENED